MAKARAPTAVIRRDMFVVTQGLVGAVGAVGQRQSGQCGLIRLIKTLTLVWPRASGGVQSEAWPGSGYFDNENNPSKISRLWRAALVQIQIWATEVSARGLLTPFMARSL